MMDPTLFVILYALAGYGWFNVVAVTEPDWSTPRCVLWGVVWPLTAIVALVLTSLAKVQRALAQRGHK